MFVTQLPFWGFFLPVLGGSILALRLFGAQARAAVLLLASWLFYGLWDWRFLGLLILSTIVVWMLALRIEQTEEPRARKGWVTLSLVFSLGMLGLFKYLGFFVDSFAALMGALGLPFGDDWAQQILRPLAALQQLVQQLVGNRHRLCSSQEAWTTSPIHRRSDTLRNWAEANLPAF
ncbi:MBOAT family O-acyltransferase [Paenirhodobacter populi]|uniref:hypothetical protein n=1 Tax=Paenirhodobacter populi TaxID=2306993 RepID=UPI0013E35688|nr:hypothetical protein [Sinirhodobacter populi]